jgi:2-keto-4-pentenoate hydratase/2-oxohepta-3-ene-1,7-dioic acid hydratase in catechol pathway
MKIARILTPQGATVTVTENNGRLERLEGSPYGAPKPTGEFVEAARWLPPVDPSMLICIGLNYRKHAVECNLPIPEQPVVFMKNIECAIGHEQPILVPKVCEDELDFECELAIVIGAPCRDVPKEKALDYVLGYTVANDVSARLWQMKRGGSQWCRGKSFDTFAPMGPFLVTAGEIPNPDNLAIKTVLNGDTVQDSNTSDMIFDVRTIISFLSQDTTLRPGTVILTGTPEGIGWTREPKSLLHSGDSVSITIENIGTLTNPVRA